MVLALIKKDDDLEPPDQIPTAEFEKYSKSELGQFVIESEKISGVGFQNTDADLSRDGFKRHQDIASIVCHRGARQLDLQLINITISNHFMSWYRTGIEGSDERVVEGEDVPLFVQKLNDEIAVRIVELRSRTYEDKDAFAWHVHDELICIHPFKSYNGRTSRLAMNHVRTLLGLDVFVIRHEKRKEYLAKLRHYKQTTFAERLRNFYGS